MKTKYRPTCIALWYDMGWGIKNNQKYRIDKNDNKLKEYTFDNGPIYGDEYSADNTIFARDFNKSYQDIIRELLTANGISFNKDAWERYWITDGEWGYWTWADAEKNAIITATGLTVVLEPPLNEQTPLGQDIIDAGGCIHLIEEKNIKSFAKLNKGFFKKNHISVEDISWLDISFIEIGINIDYEKIESI